MDGRLRLDEVSVGGFGESELLAMGVGGELLRRKVEEVRWDRAIVSRVIVPVKDFVTGAGDGLELVAALGELSWGEFFEVLGDFLDGGSDSGARFGVFVVERISGGVGGASGAEFKLLTSVSRDAGRIGGSKGFCDAPMFAGGAGFDGAQRDGEFLSDFGVMHAGSGEGADGAPIDLRFGHGSN